MAKSRWIGTVLVEVVVEESTPEQEYEEVAENVAFAILGAAGYEPAVKLTYQGDLVRIKQ